MSDAFAELLAQVAEEFSVTPEEVYRDIEEAIAAAMAEAAADPDPTAREIWARMPRAGAPNAGGDDRVPQRDDAACAGAAG